MASFADLARRLAPANPATGILASLLDFGIVTTRTQLLAAGAVREVTCGDKDVKIAAWRVTDRMALFVHNGDASGTNASRLAC